MTDLLRQELGLDPKPGSQGLEATERDPLREELFGKKEETTEITPLDPLRAELGLDPVRAPGEERESDYTGAAIRGLKSGALPFMMEREDVLAERDLGELGVEMATDLASGMGATALAGAAAGSVVPGLGTAAGAVIGGLAYAVYAGLGREYYESEARGEAFDPGRAILGMAVEGNPVIRGGSRAIRVIRTAAQIGGTAWRESEYAGGDKDVALGAALVTTVLSPLIYRGMRADAVTSPSMEGAADIMESLTDEKGLDLLVKAHRRAASWKKPKNLDDVLSWPEDFKRYVTMAPAGTDIDVIDRKLSQLSMKEELINDLWDNYAFSQSYVREAGRANDKMANSLGAMKEPMNAARKWLEDPHFVARKWDEELGDNIQGEIFDAASKANAHFELMSRPYLSRASTLMEKTQKAGISPEKMSEKVMSMDVPHSAENGLVGEWRILYSKMRKELQNSGQLNLGYIQRYLPIRMMRGADLARIVELKTERLSRRLKELEGKDGGFIKTKTLEELKAIHDIYNPNAKFNADTLSKLPDIILRSGKNTTTMEMSAAFKRAGGTIPEWAKEQDIGKLTLGYIYSNMKAVHMQPVFRNLDMRIEAMDALGLHESAKYLLRYKEHMAGVHTGFDATLNSFAQRLRKTGLDWAEQGLGKKLMSVPMKNAVDMLSFLNAQVYPSFLGMNVRAHIRNLTQNFAVTAPEIGGTYGYGLTMRGALRTAGKMKKGELLDIIRGRDPALLKRLHDLGQEGAFTRSDILTAPENVHGAMRRQLNRLNDGLMSFYTYTDVLNRNVAYDVGREWAKDVVAGKGEALSALKNLSAGRKAQIRASGVLKVTDPVARADELGDILGDYLISRTQFRYGREQLNQFGREFGPLFAAFTKWPAMIGSDLAYEASRLPQDFRRRAFRIMGKYGAPWAALTAIQGTYEDSWRHKEVPGTEIPTGYLLGKDLRDIHPAQSLFNLSLTGGPVIELAGELYRGGAGVLKGDQTPFQAMTDGGRKAITTFGAPASAAINEIDRFVKARGDKAPSEKVATEVRAAMEDLWDDL